MDILGCIWLYSCDIFFNSNYTGAKLWYVSEQLMIIFILVKIFAT